ncbi:MAG: hypothetical protein U0792_21845 [Gemmataceae bacterium]
MQAGADEALPEGEPLLQPEVPHRQGKPPPGMHGLRRGKQSEYGLRLREKQKLKRFYGILEAQFRRYYDLATRSPENTGEQPLPRFSNAVWITSCTASGLPSAAPPHANW